MPKKYSAQYAQRINKVLDYIDAHLDEELSVDKLSKVANFSRFHFHRQFTDYTGISVSRLVQLMRLKRASFQLVLNKHASITDIAFTAGFANPESFSRAFKKEQGQTPSAFRKNPQWALWQFKSMLNIKKEPAVMQVELLDFPETAIAVLEHHGPKELVFNTTMKFIGWRKASGIGLEQGRTYGVHYSDPDSTPPEDYRLDIGVSVQEPVPPNPQGVVNKVIPAGRCAKVRNIGQIDNMPAPRYLYSEWLPQSGEKLRDYPIFFHYVSIGPNVKEHEMITDVYLPLR